MCAQQKVLLYQIPSKQLTMLLHKIRYNGIIKCVAFSVDNASVNMVKRNSIKSRVTGEKPWCHVYLVGCLCHMPISMVRKSKTDFRASLMLMCKWLLEQYGLISMTKKCMNAVLLPFSCFLMVNYYSACPYR
jgi:hypothetical protein